jgi:Rps23 Pro-64 3,4-dihydroxylase Tpa1-like proline 4-hydroxylase
MCDALTQDQSIRQTQPRSEIAPDSQDYICINGVKLSLNEIINEDFLTPKKIKELSETYSKNAPFPHLVFENLFSPKLLELMDRDFEALKWTNWRRYDNANELKRGSLPNTRFGSATQLYFNTIYSGIFLKFLTDVTGVNGLVTDPEFHGGGLHDIAAGGKFAMHIDFNQHPVTKLANRFVLITYLNKDWAPSYGGDLELWDVDEQTCGSQSRRRSEGRSFFINPPEACMAIPIPLTRQTAVRVGPPQPIFIQTDERMKMSASFIPPCFHSQSSCLKETRRSTPQNSCCRQCCL